MDKKILAELRAHFPWLMSDEPVSGADVVDELCNWYNILVNKCEPKGQRKKSGARWTGVGNVPHN
jgi:hypothetical protein